MHAVIEAADKLFEIATEIEKALVDAGCQPLIDNSGASAQWQAKSLKVLVQDEAGRHLSRGGRCHRHSTSRRNPI